jgi:surface protein
MAYMFTEAAAFDQDLSAWNTSLVTNMSHMFTNASLFGSYTLFGPISNWDVSSVTNMSSMFLGASSFDQDLYNWNVSNVSDFTSFLTGATTFTSSNLGQIYNGWSALPSLQTGVTFDAPNTCYQDDAYTIANRDGIIAGYGWTINDGGVCPAYYEFFMNSDSTAETACAGLPGLDPRYTMPGSPALAIGVFLYSGIDFGTPVVDAWYAWEGNFMAYQVTGGLGEITAEQSCI